MLLSYKFQKTITSANEDGNKNYNNFNSGLDQNMNDQNNT